MDESSYWQRVKRIFTVMDPRIYLASSESIENAIQVLHQQKQGTNVDANLLSRSQQLVEAFVHPDTKRLISPRFLSVCYIVPCNTVLDWLMLSSAGNPALSVAAQLANQTYNASHYYANRNATNTESILKVSEGFAAAIGSSVGITLLLHRVLKSAKTQMHHNLRWALLTKFIPFFAVSAGDICNLAIVRRNEYLQGVNVHTASGELVGQSRIAGAMAVSSCLSVRLAALIPILCVPPMIVARWSRVGGCLSKRPALRLPVLLCVVATAIQGTVPAVFGLFKQRASVDACWLESRFHKYENQQLFYTKGW